MKEEVFPADRLNKLLRRQPKMSDGDRWKRAEEIQKRKEVKNMAVKFFVRPPYVYEKIKGSEEESKLIVPVEIYGLPADQIADGLEDYARMAKKGFTLGRIIAFLSNFLSFFKF